MESTDLPKLDLTTFMLSISSAAMMHLGVVPQNTKLSPQIDLTIAKQNIDLLELLLEKTQGNRTPEEDRLLQELLFQTRMRFIEVTKKQS